MIHDYNLFMIGVDKLDQLMSYYSFLHKSVKWWRKVFFLGGASSCRQCLHHLQGVGIEETRETHEPSCV
jgi:hypothetical protein